MKLSSPPLRAPLKLLSSRSLETLAGRWSAGLGPRDLIDVDTTARRLLMYTVVPAWLGSGLADYFYHRQTHIERTSGARESLLHALMLAEAGVPTLAGLFFDVDAGVLATALAALAAHEVTAIWDLAYANPRRYTSPGEQHVHGFLQVLPFMAAGFLFVLQPRQARGLLGLGGERPRFGLRLKIPPLPLPYIGALFAGMLLFGVIPYAEEFVRCLLTKPTLAPQPVAAPPGPHGVPAGVHTNGTTAGLESALLGADSPGERP